MCCKFCSKMIRKIVCCFFIIMRGGDKNSEPIIHILDVFVSFDHIHRQRPVFVTCDFTSIQLEAMRNL
jgi:hypothetical protein